MAFRGGCKLKEFRVSGLVVQFPVPSSSVFIGRWLFRVKGFGRRVFWRTGFVASYSIVLPMTPKPLFDLLITLAESRDRNHPSLTPSTLKPYIIGLESLVPNTTPVDIFMQFIR